MTPLSPDVEGDQHGEGEDNAGVQVPVVRRHAPIVPRAQQKTGLVDRMVRMPSEDSALLGEIESLYRERFADFVAVAASIVGERESAREAVQDAFASVVRTRRDFRGEAPLEAWVWRAVVNAARKRRGRYAREVQLRSVSASTNGTAPNHERSELATLIALLPERQRLVLFLRYYADLDYRRIAQILRVEVGTVSATLHAAHTSLRRALKEVQR
jgi:RNA polymerase sigma-70 factor (ECF subfamily)